MSAHGAFPSNDEGVPRTTARRWPAPRRTISATYEQPYVRHAPLSPYVAVADVRSDGLVTVWTHSSQSQGLRARIATAFNIPMDKVVVRWLEHAGQYGRTTLGGDGAEADAVILSQLTGKPVRVQWTLQEDMAWSSVSPGWVADIQGGLGADGRLTAVSSAFYSPHQFDARMLGSVLAGLPGTAPAPNGWLATEWPYDESGTGSSGATVCRIWELARTAWVYAGTSCARPASASRISYWRG